MKTLEKTMTEFVLEENKYFDSLTDDDFWDSLIHLSNRIHNYAKLLPTPLTLGMFVPVDDDGNVLEEPEYYDKWLTPNKFSYTGLEFDSWKECCSIYKKALSNVLFDGFEITDESEGKSELWRLSNEDGFCLLFSNFYDRTKSLNLKTIEDLIPFKLKLTDNFKL